MEEFALKFLLGSNLKEHPGEAEVMREVETSAEKCSMTAGLSLWLRGEGLWGRGYPVGSDLEG